MCPCIGSLVEVIDDLFLSDFVKDEEEPACCA